MTVNEVSERYNVSTKTVDRWRSKGLVSRRFRFGKRKRIGFLKSSVDRFVRTHADDVHRGSRFSQLTDGERENIISRARRMARAGGCPAEISRRIARRIHRSVETVRYTLKNHDKEHPEAAVFPHASRPLNEEDRRHLYRESRRGVPAERLARQYCRTKASIYRIITEVRAAQLIEQPIDYMDSDEFRVTDAEGLILGPPPEVRPEEGTVSSHRPDCLPIWPACIAFRF